MIGVVCADANEFKFAGPALLLLVSAVIALLLSIQLGYHARQWIYSYEEICNWTARKCPTNRSLETQSKDFRKGKEKLDRAGLAYNAGTVFLSFAVAAALIPDRPGDLTVWRWIAAAFVTAAAIGESIWAIKIYAGTIGQFDHPTKSHSTPPSEGGNPHV
ncbi:hypothetical protein [Streptomyces spinosisporus]|uniref:Uncharacterized protein n=1 Tax=Streptomyces spinosisporus TaxID=2927582 RepID=A0ABS9XBZ0_9ACTN|nr:hypothetical protein [Streptomyces spinosisporus]MCI3239578.1 hypothetical protein [Streptomyces spinosisporus]